MNSQVLFPHIGKVIASTGSRRFPRMLHDLILTQLAVDATHITQLRTDPEQTVEGTSRNTVHHCHPLHGQSANDDSLLHAAFPDSFSHQERLLLEDISPLLLPMVEKHISALQPRGLDGEQDSAAIEGLETLRLRFADRLAQSGLSLSNREMEVCVGLLAGRTAPQLAEQCQLKVNTVESYLKRAAIKLGISGRHSLLRWMYSPQEAAAPVAANAPE
ncbi:LuxR family transcriptional regulator [Pseudomonas sp. ABAC61]|nr:LuxR family transcriptional regulator [Pseudomonas sp. ABAC61]